MNECFFENFSNIIVERKPAKDYFENKQNNKKSNKFFSLFKGLKNDSANDGVPQIRLDILEELEMN